MIPGRIARSFSVFPGPPPFARVTHKISRRFQNGAQRVQNVLVVVDTKDYVFAVLHDSPLPGGATRGDAAF